jgi:Asp-tRNA(Asn)/Glu-tRNA(Gln) amidotransferase A subunit family amidase
MMDATTSARSIAACVRAGKSRARDVVAGALERIARRDGALNAFTAVLGERALADADTIDRRLAAGDDPGPLAGVPFAAKNLFDVAGLATLAGSKINADHPPAARDAAAVARLRAAGAVLVGALNMDEYAYGFSTENTHYGPTRNPRDPSRIAGGSSGGSAAAVAGGLVPLTLGTDTNGSIRVPAALCGVFGLKPTFGRVSRAGVVPLAWSFDHVGPFARHVADLATAFDAIAGPDPLDPACSTLPPPRCSGELERGIDGLRLAVAGGHFARLAADEALAAVTRVAAALGARREVSLPEAHRAPRRRAGDHRVRGQRLPPREPPGTRRRLRSDDPRPLAGRRPAPGRGLPARAALPRVVPGARRRGLPRGGRAARAHDAVDGAGDRRAVDDPDRRDGGAHARPPRRLHPAAVVHRPARDLGPAGVGGGAARRRATDRGAVQRGRPLPCRGTARGRRRGGVPARSF